jgi:hypothetical protein
MTYHGDARSYVYLSPGMWYLVPSLSSYLWEQGLWYLLGITTTKTIIHMTFTFYVCVRYTDAFVGVEFTNTNTYKYYY